MCRLGPFVFSRFGVSHARARSPGTFRFLRWGDKLTLPIHANIGTSGRTGRRRGSHVNAISAGAESAGAALRRSAVIATAPNTLGATDIQLVF